MQNKDPIQIAGARIKKEYRFLPAIHDSMEKSSPPGIKNINSIDFLLCRTN
jgi:hypothetical protein